MPESIGSLESKLRDKARQDLAAEINSAAEPLKQLMPVSQMTVRQDVDRFGGANLHLLLSILKDAIFDFHVENYAQKAIRDFMNKVEHLPPLDPEKA